MSYSDTDTPGIYLEGLIGTNKYKFSSTINEIVPIVELINFNTSNYTTLCTIDAVDFLNSVSIMSDDTSYINFNCTKKQVTLTSVTDMGLLLDKIQIKTYGTAMMDMDYVFQKKYMKCIIQLAKSFENISIQHRPTGSPDECYPVLFGNKSQINPYVKMNIYIMPCVNE
jgi:hypothetical protein